MTQSGLWLVCSSHDPMPRYGWKIHVSATLQEAQSVLNVVSQLAFESDCSFKYLFNEKSFRTLHFKNGSRLQSGKFIALYPRSESCAELLMKSLKDFLNEYEGLDVLTDKSFRGSHNVFYRWGAFVASGRINDQGEPEDLIPDGRGNWIPDKRLPYFSVPNGIKDPFDQAEEKIASTASPPKLKIDRFEVESVIRFTNAGGRYKALDKLTNMPVVLKEARPHTGFVGFESAIPRLEYEAKVLKNIGHKAPGVAPLFIKDFSLKGHYFIALSYIDGTLLSDWIAQNNPFYSVAYKNPKTVNDYFENVDLILRKIRDDILQLHAIGVAFGDLSLSNIIIDGNGNPKLIDFESCLPVDSENPSIGTPDFCFIQQDAQLTARERDWFSFHCIAVAVILRLNTLAEISDHVLIELERELHSITYSPLPNWWYRSSDYIRRETNLKSQFKVHNFKHPELANEKHLRVFSEEIYCGIKSNIYLENDFIFPASRQSLNGANHSLACGDGGILQVLHKDKGIIDEEILDRFDKVVRRKIDNNLIPLGHEFGLAGIADIASNLGLTELADRAILELVERWDSIESPTLASGLCGIALTLNRHSYSDLSKDVMVKAIDLCKSYDWTKNGLLYGKSGIIAAICNKNFSPLLEQSGVSEQVEELISQELDQTVLHPIGKSISLRGEINGKRLLPYLRDGTAGLVLALVLASDCQNLDYDISDEKLKLLAADIASPLMLEASLMDGLAGLSVILEYIKYKRPNLNSEIPDARWSALSKYFLPCGDGIGLLNPRTYKFDFSLHQGSAGVLNALRWLGGDSKLFLSGLELSPRFINKSTKC